MKSPHLEGFERILPILREFTNISKIFFPFSPLPGAWPGRESRDSTTQLGECRRVSLVAESSRSVNCTRVVFLLAGLFGKADWLSFFRYERLWTGEEEEEEKSSVLLQKIDMMEAENNGFQMIKKKSQIKWFHLGWEFLSHQIVLHEEGGDHRNRILENGD